MKKFILLSILVAIILFPCTSRGQLSVVDNKPYADRFLKQPLRQYTDRISADVPAMCWVRDIRSAHKAFPGDYFWPARTYSKNKDIIMPNSEEKRQIMQFLKESFPGKFQDSSLIDSAQNSTYQCSFRTDSIRNEFYLMLSEGDTIYVISGWYGKFMSLFRATPYEKIPTPANFIAEAKEIAPGLGKMGWSDSSVKAEYYPDSLIKIAYYPAGDDSAHNRKTYDRDQFVTMQPYNSKIEKYPLKNDTAYFMEAYNAANSMWLRNYRIREVLPPSNPKKGKEKAYNLIEISKIYDREMFELRRFLVFHDTY